MSIYLEVTTQDGLNKICMVLTGIYLKVGIILPR